MSRNIQFLDKGKKNELTELEQKLTELHKKVELKLIDDDFPHKEKLKYNWKKCYLFEKDINVNAVIFFEIYTDFSVCNELNLLIGEYFIYLCIYLKSVKNKNPLKLVNAYVLINNKWKEKLIYRFLKNLFIQDDEVKDIKKTADQINGRDSYNNIDKCISADEDRNITPEECENAKVLVIEHLVKNLEIYASTVKHFFSNILLYINKKLQILFSKRNQNYLNIFANFFISYGNVIHKSSKQLLQVFFMLSQNIKSILLHFPFDKDICTHVCLIYEKLKHIVLNSEKEFKCTSELTLQNVLANNSKEISFEKNHCKTQRMILEKCKSPEQNKLEKIDSETDSADNNADVEEKKECLCLIEKTIEVLNECDLIIKKKKKENPVLILCKYRSVLIIKYKHITKINVEDTFNYFLLFFKITNLLHCDNNHNNPFFVFLCIETIGYWLNKSDKLIYPYESDNFLEEEKHHQKTNNNPEMNIELEKNEKKQTCVINRITPHLKYAQKEEVETTKKNCKKGILHLEKTEKQKQLPYSFCSTNDFYNCSPNNMLPYEEKEKIKEINKEEMKNKKSNNMTDVDIKNWKYIFLNCTDIVKKVQYLKEMYIIIIETILSILQKYTWFNIKLIWNVCIHIYEHLLTSPKTVFVKKEIYNQLTHIIFHQEKKKNFVCFSLLIKHFKNCLCEKNIMDYLFYSFFSEDDMFISHIYELLKCCMKHIFVYAKEETLSLYYTFLKNVVTTKHFNLKTFYIKKFVELFAKYDIGYVPFILHRGYYDLLHKNWKASIEAETHPTNIKNDNRNHKPNKNYDISPFSHQLDKKGNYKMCVENETIYNDQFFQNLCIKETSMEFRGKYRYISKRETENIFFNFYKIRFYFNGNDGDGDDEMEGDFKFKLYDFHVLENLAFLELHTLCVLRKQEQMFVVNNGREEYFYVLNDNVLLNINVLTRLLYCSNLEIVLSVLAFISESKYLNICDLYLFWVFLNISIMDITRNSRDMYRKYISAFLTKFFIFFQRIIEYDKKNGTCSCCDIGNASKEVNEEEQQDKEEIDEEEIDEEEEKGVNVNNEKKKKFTNEDTYRNGKWENRTDDKERERKTNDKHEKQIKKESFKEYHKEYFNEVNKVSSFLYGTHLIRMKEGNNKNNRKNSNRASFVHKNNADDDVLFNECYASCVFYSSSRKYLQGKVKNVFLYNYYLINIIFLLFKNIHKNIGVETSMYCSDILSIIFENNIVFENLNFLFFLFNVKTTWKELYLYSRENFFKTMNIVLLKKHNLNLLRNSFFSLVKSHKQVDHSFSSFMLNLCFTDLNQQAIQTQETAMLNANKNEKRNKEPNKVSKSSGFMPDNISLIKNIHVKDFCNCLVRWGNLKCIKEQSKHLKHIMNHLLEDSYKHDISKSVPLYIFENFITKMKKESIFQLNSPKDLEKHMMYKLAYHVNEFLLYLKRCSVNNANSGKINNDLHSSSSNNNNNNNSSSSSNRRRNCNDVVHNELSEPAFFIFLRINLYNIYSFLNFDNFQLYDILNSSTCFSNDNGVNSIYKNVRGNEKENGNELLISYENDSYLILMKVYACTILYYLITYLDFLFLNNSDKYFFDCRGHIIFGNENERESPSVILWLSVKYICTLIVSIVDFSFTLHLRTVKKTKNERANCEKENIPVHFFNQVEIHFIIQNILCLLLYTKHFACQQYLSDCLLNICKIILTKANGEMHIIPLFYIHIILLAFKDNDERNIETSNEQDVVILNKEKKGTEQDKLRLKKKQEEKEKKNEKKKEKKKEKETEKETEKDYLESFNRIINSLNKFVNTKSEKKDIEEVLSVDFLKHHFPLSEKLNVTNLFDNRDLWKEEKNIFDCKEGTTFGIKQKMNMLIIGGGNVSRNFLRKSSNLCLALNSLVKAYKVKEQFIIYNFIIKIIITYLYNGKNTYKKIMCINILKDTYSTIDNKTLYEYINDIYNISLIYYKSSVFGLKSSSTSLYNVLTKRLLAKLNFSYHISASNIYNFCSGSKTRTLKNINSTFFDLFNSVHLLEIFLRVFEKNINFSDKKFTEIYKYRSFFDYSNIFAQFIPILVFLSNVLIFNYDEYVMCYREINKEKQEKQKKTKKQTHIETGNAVPHIPIKIKKEDEEIHTYLADSCRQTNFYCNDDQQVNNEKMSNQVQQTIYFLFLDHFKKLFFYGNYFVQILVSRIVVNIYIHIYLKMRKEKLLFYFLNRILWNAKKYDNNCYLLLFLEFIKRKELTSVMTYKNNEVWKNFFYQLFSLFIKNNIYSTNILILQILNILYKKIDQISLHQNVIFFLFKKQKLFQNDIYFCVVANELLMRIVKTLPNFLFLLEVYVKEKKEKCIEAFLYMWKLFLKRKDKRKFLEKEKWIQEKRFREYNDNSYHSHRTVPQKYDDQSFKKRMSENFLFVKETQNENISVKNRTTCFNSYWNERTKTEDQNETTDERVFIYLYLLLFEIIMTYDNNTKIKKYCFRVMLTIVKMISLENLVVFDKMYDYYLNHKNSIYLDKYLIPYSYIICSKFWGNVDKWIEGNKQEVKLTEQWEKRKEEKRGKVTEVKYEKCNFLSALYFFIDEEKRRIMQNSKHTYKEQLRNCIHFYILYFMNFLSLLYNKNSTTYIQYFVKVFIDTDIIKYDNRKTDKAFSFLFNTPNDIGNNDRDSSTTSINNRNKYNKCNSKIVHEEVNFKKQNFLLNWGERNIGSKSVTGCGFFKNRYVMDAQDFMEWYVSNRHLELKNIVEKRLSVLHIEADFIYEETPLQHLQHYDLFTSFFILLYSCILFMLNDENETIRYRMKILIFYFMNRDVTHITTNISNSLCTEFFIHFISTFYNSIFLNFLIFSIYQTKSCITDNFYYNPIKVFDAEKYNLYINNVTLNHLLTFYYMRTVIIETKGCNKIKKETKNVRYFLNFYDFLELDMPHKEKFINNSVQWVSNMDWKRSEHVVHINVENINVADINVENINVADINVENINDLLLLKHRQMWKILLSQRKRINEFTYFFKKKDNLNISHLWKTNVHKKYYSYNSCSSNSSSSTSTSTSTSSIYCSNYRSVGYIAESTKVFSCSSNFLLAFQMCVQLNYITDIKKSLKDYLHLVLSNTVNDMYDSNFVLCLSNLINKICILLINVYVFFYDKISVYYNSYFFEEIEAIKKMLKQIYESFVLIRFEMNPFIFKNVETLYYIVNSEMFLKNKTFFMKIFLLLYTLKSSI